MHFARKCIHASSSAFEEGIVCIGRKAKTTAAVYVRKLGSIVHKPIDGLSTLPPTLCEKMAKYDKHYEMVGSLKKG